MGVFLKRTLTEFAVNSENIANHMMTLAWVSKDSASLDLKYERFSADNGVCYIKLDSYKELEQIENLTLQYLGTRETQTRLKEVGEEIAREYLQKRRIETGPVATNERLVVPEYNGLAPQTRVANGPEPNTHSRPSTNVSSEHSETSTCSGPSRDPSTDASAPEIRPPPVIPSRQTTGIVLPAESMVDTSETMADSTVLRA